MEENNNLKLWKAVEETDPNHTKKVTFGANFTSINATYQIMNATEQFGTYGNLWGIESIDYEYINLDLGQIMVLARAVFRYPIDGNLIATFPISSTIMMQEYSKKWKSLTVDDEWAKKIETDITTKALSKLGFNADVFMGMYDDNRYVNSLKKKYAKEAPPKPLPKISEDNFSKYLEAILKGSKDKQGELITIDYLKARHTLTAEQELELTQN